MVFLTDIISKWSHHYVHFNMSSDLFYNTLLQKLKDIDMPKLNHYRIHHNEFGIFSYEREYLRVTRYDLHFDICAAPYGKTFFISWWLFEADNGFIFLLKLIPFLRFLTRYMKRRSFYQVDTENIFLSTIHACVLETIAELIVEPQFVLSDSEKQFHIAGL